jgi:hypothetical protein
MSKNIYQRVNDVMKSVSYAKKDAQISGAGANYKAVTRDSVVGLLREHLVENGIVIETSQISGKWDFMRDMNATPTPIKMGLYSGYYEVRAVNIDNPDDKISINIEAHANDNGDKAPGKAATYAEKTALLKIFLLQTGLNDEARQEQKRTDAQMQDKFGYLIETSDAMGLFLFMSQFSPDDPVRDELFDSVPYGKKTLIRNSFIELNSKAYRMFEEFAETLITGIKNKDAQCIKEYWWDLENVQKQAVWGKLPDEMRDQLKSMKG